MYFIGQRRIRQELNLILLEISRGQNFNLLFRAPSGYGKTTLAFFMGDYIGGGYNYVIPAETTVNLNRAKRTQIIDEIHLLTTPEVIYPVMDSGDHTFIFCTNESGILKEPLINRCIPFIFDPYTDDEIKGIIRHNLSIEVNENVMEEIVKVVKRVPRIATILSRRLVYTFRYNGVPNTKEQITDVLSTLGYEDGLSVLEKRYLDFLESAGGRAGLELLSNALRIDKGTIVREIEPGLIYLNLVRITGKGRELCQ